MSEVCAIVAARAFRWTIARGDDYCFALFQANGMADRLRAGLLFQQQQLASGEFLAGLAQADDDLEGEKALAIEILMEAIIIARSVPQDEWRRPLLTGVVASL